MFIVMFTLDVVPAQHPYIITPCTFYPGVRAEFMLYVLADVPTANALTLERVNYEAYFKMLREQEQQGGEKDKVENKAPTPEQPRQDRPKEVETVSTPVTQTPQIQQSQPTSVQAAPAVTTTCPCCGAMFNISTKEVLSSPTGARTSTAPVPPSTPTVPSAPPLPPPKQSVGESSTATSSESNVALLLKLAMSKLKAVEKSPRKDMAAPTAWVMPFNYEKIVAGRRAAMELSDDEDDEDSEWNEDYYMK